MSLKGVPKPYKYVPKISENWYFEFSHYAIPPSGDAPEKFNA